MRAFNPPVCVNGEWVTVIHGGSMHGYKMGGDPLGEQERRVRERKEYRCIYLSQPAVTSPSDRVQYQEVGAGEAVRMAAPPPAPRRAAAQPETRERTATIFLQPEGGADFPHGERQGGEEDPRASNATASFVELSFDLHMRRRGGDKVSRSTFSA